jgi:TolB-like protein
VLPFQNMSGDPEQEFFADGISEDITTALSKVRWFFVITRNTSFTYKGSVVDVKQVGRELGVRYVLEGSVRKADTRIRITAQLVNAPTGNHVWAERYDRELADIFAVQDEITERVVGARSADRAWPRCTGSLGAYDPRPIALADASPPGGGASAAPGIGVEPELRAGSCLSWSAARPPRGARGSG